MLSSHLSARAWCDRLSFPFHTSVLSLVNIAVIVRHGLSFPFHTSVLSYVLLRPVKREGLSFPFHTSVLSC